MNTQLLPLDAVRIVDGKPTTTSLKVAKVFSKEHRKVAKAISSLDVPKEWGMANFVQTPYIHSQNGQTYQMYQMTKDGFTLLVMGFTGKKAMQFKIAYIEAFNAMEAELKKPRYPKRSATGSELEWAIGKKFRQRLIEMPFEEQARLYVSLLDKNDLKEISIQPNPISSLIAKFEAFPFESQLLLANSIIALEKEEDDNPVSDWMYLFRKLPKERRQMLLNTIGGNIQGDISGLDKLISIAQ